MTDRNPIVRRYALFGIPLGFIGLPLYMHLPKYYAEALPLSLAVLGGLMFFTRLADCFLDPWIGTWCDRYPHRRKHIMGVAGVTVVIGVAGLFTLPLWAASLPLGWVIGALLLLAYLSYSVLAINYYAFGLTLADNPARTAGLSAYREVAIAVGVLFASSLPLLVASSPYLWFAGSFAAVLMIAFLLAHTSFLPSGRTIDHSVSPWDLLRSDARLRWIYGVFFFNAVAPSITATLFLFYVADVLKLAEQGSLFLGVYFLSAMVAMPLWAKAAARLGKRRTLLVSMALALASFIWAYALGAGDYTPFLIICILSGAAYGGEMALLPSLLADALGNDPARGGAAFGIWNFISKFTLALAAGLSLPALEWFGYQQGTDATAGLSIAYALIPCLFKSLAFSLLFISPLSRERTRP